MGASGAVVESGSFLDLTTSTREEGEISAMGMLEEGDMTGWRLETQRDNYLQSAALSRASKVNTGSVLAGSILSGVATVGSAYSSLDSAGVFKTPDKTATVIPSGNPKKGN